MAVVTIVVGVPEEDVVGKQDGAGLTETWHWVRRKWLENKMAQVLTETCDCLKKWLEKNGAGFNRSYGGSEEDVVGKQNGAVRIRSRR